MKNQPVNNVSPELVGEFDPEAILRRESRVPNLISWVDGLDRVINEGIVLIDESLHIIYFSPKAVEISGWEPEEVCGKNFNEIFTTEVYKFSIKKSFVHINKIQRMVLNHRNGHPIFINASISPFPSISGEPKFYTIIFRDISEVEPSKKLQASFLANITHEFRTPLSSLNASVEFLLDEFENLSREEIATLLTSVSLSVTGLQTLIDNLLESIKIEAGRFSVSLRPADLVGIIEEAKRVMSPLLIRRQQWLNIYLPGDLPKVICDPSSLTQVLVNLLSNASKYGPTQQGIDIRVMCDEAGMAKVSVIDRGPGIPRQERKKIFNQFYRLETKSNAQDGIGLGLWVVRMIIEEHGGEVGVEGPVGEGTVFWFKIPISKEDS